VRLGSVVFPVVALFFLSEAVLSLTKRARFAARGRSVDRGTRALLVIVITAAIMAAVMLSGLPAGRIPWGTPGVPLAALGLLIAGFALRIWAVVTLGRFFTVDVAVHDDHVLVASGPYRVMRHPSYTGLLLEFAGLGVALGSFASVIVLVIPIGAALLHRIRVEEAALCSALGATYAAYAAKTKRLVPGVY
jgi:protein-S-isoprenylcysteine O-methyltransferase